MYIVSKVDTKHTAYYSRTHGDALVTTFTCGERQRYQSKTVEALVIRMGRRRCKAASLMACICLRRFPVSDWQTPQSGYRSWPPDQSA